jgi:hypothetical protein
LVFCAKASPVPARASAISDATINNTRIDIVFPPEC